MYHHNFPVLGLTVVKDEVPESNVKLHIATCLEVVRGKMGAEVDVMVYTNKELNTSEDTTVKDTVLTSWQGTSLFTSTPEIESRKLYDGGLVLKTPISKNCEYSDKNSKKTLPVKTTLFVKEKVENLPKMFKR